MGSLLSCLRRHKYNKDNIQGKNILIIENEVINIFEIKRKLKQMRSFIRVIRISNCISNKNRFESLNILLLREDL